MNEIENTSPTKDKLCLIDILTKLGFTKLNDGDWTRATWPDGMKFNTLQAFEYVVEVITSTPLPNSPDELKECASIVMILIDLSMELPVSAETKLRLIYKALAWKEAEQSDLQ